MIKILHVVPKITTGGVASVVLNMFEHIDKTRYEFHILTHDDPYFDRITKEHKGLFIYNVSGIGTVGIKEYKNQIKDIILQHSFDILQIHTGHLLVVYGHLFRKFYNGKIILHAHTTKVVNNKHKLLMPLFRVLSKNKVYTRVSCGKEAGKFCYGSSKFTIVENGIDYHSLLNQEGSQESIKFFKWLNDKLENRQILLCNVAAFTTPKNHSFLIDILHDTIKYNKNVHLLLVGSGDLQNKVKEKVDNLNLQNNVHFLGHKDDVGFILNNCDIFILPSLYEGLPVSAIEAQALNKLCLLSDKIDKTVVISENTKLLSITSTDAWVKNIINYNKKLLVYNNFVDSKYNIQVSVKKMENIYNHI